MIISMSNIICITNRNLCKEDFLKRIDTIAKSKPKAVILREKDLRQEDYFLLAGKIMTICNKYNVPFVMHSFYEAAVRLNCPYIHMPLHVLEAMPTGLKKRFRAIGASCHSVEDALKAKELGCTYITAGHIFETDCKKGLPGRGLKFLEDVVNAVDIPVYAIGGIDKSNFDDIKKAGAKGACLMSSLMTSDNPEELINM